MSVIDIPTFDELKKMAGPAFLNELIDTFLDDAPRMLEDMRTALEAQDADSFRRAAHSMKSNASTFGAGHLAELAKELESFGRENKLSETGDRLTALEEALRSACEELRGLKT